MARLTFLLILSLAVTSLFAWPPDDTLAYKPSVVVIPYMPMMHLSDADQHIAEGSGMMIPEMRTALRKGLVESLNQQVQEVYDTKLESSDFVSEDNRDLDVIYHSLLFEQDSVYPLKYPKRFPRTDSTGTAQKKSKEKMPKYPPEKTYINVGINDAFLIPDLAARHDADYFIFLNELDIKTHFDDCLNLALKIYQREIKVHYTIFDKNGKQVYGDVAVSHFPSNTNDVDQIIAGNFPKIGSYVMHSLERVHSGPVE